MTDAGWHPDPHGRADRRYHDGVGWTEHVTDAEGRTTSIDPVDADTPPPPAPPPAAAPPADPPPAAAPPAVRTSSGTLTPRPSSAPDPAPAPVIGPPPPRASAPPTTPPATGPRTQRLSPEDIAAATAAPVSPPPVARPADHTVQMSADEVAAAAAAARSAPPSPGATAGRHTEPIEPEDVAAAAALAEERGRATPARSVARGTPDRGAGTRPSVPGLVAALVGAALGVVGLLLLSWTTGARSTLSYSELRRVVDDAGPDLGAVALAYLLTGALFAVGVGGVVALARAIGRPGIRLAAVVVVVLGTAGLAVLGYLAIEADRVGPTRDGVDAGPVAGSPITLVDGTPVTEPSTGAEVTVPEDGAGAAGLTDEQLTGAAVQRAEDRLATAATVGAVALVAAGALLAVGLLLGPGPGRIVTALGLVLLAAWGLASVLALGDGEIAGDAGPGGPVVVAGTLVMAIGAALPARRRRATAAPGPGAGPRV